VLSPLLLATAAAIKLLSPGPVFFCQRRYGLGGHPFTIYKFRTMCVNAEQRKAELRKFSEQDGPAFKMKSDPRITRFGRILRATSIDELPQLFNVLLGDMSIVGPRPLPCDEAARCLPWQQRRMDVTPGLTCIWQVEGRSRVSFDDWVRMDVRYIQSRSLANDAKLIAQTLPAVVLRKGAC
jgi:lipopolysaccharide/colanic/teichoic acid biosynthesis glycosyltransferase